MQEKIKERGHWLPRCMPAKLSDSTVKASRADSRSTTPPMPRKASAIATFAARAGLTPGEIQTFLPSSIPSARCPRSLALRSFC